MFRSLRVKPLEAVMAHQRTANRSPPLPPPRLRAKWLQCRASRCETFLLGEPRKLGLLLLLHVARGVMLKTPILHRCPPSAVCNSQPDACCINTDSAVPGCRVLRHGIDVRAESHISREICSSRDPSVRKSQCMQTTTLALNSHDASGVV